jgi:hypothetical protein
MYMYVQNALELAFQPAPLLLNWPHCSSHATPSPSLLYESETRFKLIYGILHIECTIDLVRRLTHVKASPVTTQIFDPQAKLVWRPLE